jgi:hypothetical protein
MKIVILKIVLIIFIICAKIKEIFFLKATCFLKHYGGVQGNSANLRRELGVILFVFILFISGIGINFFKLPGFSKGVLI